MSLQRLVLTFKPESVEVRALYRKKNGPNPGTKTRTKVVTELTRTGLERAIKALEGGAECVGTSGFTIREDVLLATTSPDAAELAKGASMDIAHGEPVEKQRDAMIERRSRNGKTTPRTTEARSSRPLSPATTNGAWRGLEDHKDEQ